MSEKEQEAAKAEAAKAAKQAQLNQKTAAMLAAQPVDKETEKLQALQNQLAEENNESGAQKVAVV